MLLAYIILDNSSKTLRSQISSTQENHKDRIYMIREIRGNCRNYIYEKSSEKEVGAIKISSKTLIRGPEKVGQKLLCFS